MVRWRENADWLFAGAVIQVCDLPAISHPLPTCMHRTSWALRRAVIQASDLELGGEIDLALSTESSHVHPHTCTLTRAPSHVHPDFYPHLIIILTGELRRSMRLYAACTSSSEAASRVVGAARLEELARAVRRVQGEWREAEAEASGRERGECDGSAFQGC